MAKATQPSNNQPHQPKQRPTKLPKLSIKAQASKPTQPSHKPRRIKLTPEELEKVQKAKALSEAQKVEPEYYIMAEFGYYFGYEGIRAIINNELELGQVNQLLMASRKIWTGQTADMAQASFIAAASANSKKPGRSFRQAIKHIRKAAKI